MGLPVGGVTDRIVLFAANQMAPAIVRRGTVVAGVNVSVKESESHQYTAQMTSLALESGAIVSDHVILQPEKVAVVVGVTNTAQQSAALVAFDLFTEMWQTREPVELVTEHVIYTDMVLTEFSPVHAAPFKGAFTANCVFQKVHYVELQTVGKTAGKTNGVASKTATGPVNAGQTAAASDNVSLAKQTTGKIAEAGKQAVEDIGNWFSNLGKSASDTASAVTQSSYTRSM